MSIYPVGCDRICVSIIYPIRTNETSFFSLLLKSDPRAKRSCVDEILFQRGCLKILCGVRILPPPLKALPFFLASPAARAPCSCVLRGQGQHLTGFYWFIFLLCSTDCCDTMANFRNTSPASSEAVLLWNIRMAKANICIRRAEGSSPHFTPQPSIHWFGGEKKKERSLLFPWPAAADRSWNICLSERGGGGAASQETSHKESQSSPQSVEWLKHSIVLNMNESSLWRAVCADPPCPPISYMINQITPGSREGK